MDYPEYKRAKIGWALLPKLTEFLGLMCSKIELIYLYETHELVITDEKLLEHLDYLQIDYELKHPSNAIKFISSIKED